LVRQLAFLGLLGRQLALLGLGSQLALLAYTSLEEALVGGYSGGDNAL